MKPNARQIMNGTQVVNPVVATVNPDDVTPKTKKQRGQHKLTREQKLEMLTGLVQEFGFVVQRKQLQQFAEAKGVKWPAMAFIFNHTACYTTLELENGKVKKSGVYDLRKIKGFEEDVQRFSE